MIRKGKKIKFALRMKDDVEVRTLQEFKEAFDLNQAVTYFLDGRLETWLSDRYYDDLAEQIQSLNKSDPELRKKLCEIFAVEYEEDSLSVEEIEERNQRIQKLKEITDDEEIIKNIDSVAFSQEDLADLLDEGVETIYLCGTDFQIPVSKKGIKYIGIKTKLDITQEKWKKYQLNDIELIDLLEEEKFDEQEIVTKTVENNSVKNISDNVHAVVLYKTSIGGISEIYMRDRTKDGGKLAYTKKSLISQEKIYLETIESFFLSNTNIINAFYNEDKIIYESEDEYGSLFGIIDFNGKNNRIIKRLSKEIGYFSNRYIVGKKYILTEVDNKTYFERTSIYGTVEKISSLSNTYFLYPWMAQRFWEMPQGFFAIDNDSIYKEIILYELLNEENEIRIYKLPFKDYTNSLCKLCSTYGDPNTRRIYFFCEPPYYEGRGWGDFYYLDINTKKIHRAVNQKTLLLHNSKDFVVKDNKIIYFNCDEKSGKDRLTVLDMTSGKKQYLWEEINTIKTFQYEKSLHLIGDYLYFIKGNSNIVKENDICIIKIDGSEKAIVEEKRGMSPSKEIIKICSPL